MVGFKYEKKELVFGASYFEEILLRNEQISIIAVIKKDYRTIFSNLENNFSEVFTALDLMPKSEFNKVVDDADIILSTSFREVNSVFILQSLKEVNLY